MDAWPLLHSAALEGRSGGQHWAMRAMYGPSACHRWTADLEHMARSGWAEDGPHEGCARRQQATHGRYSRGGGARGDVGWPTLGREGTIWPAGMPSMGGGARTHDLLEECAKQVATQGKNTHGQVMCSTQTNRGRRYEKTGAPGRGAGTNRYAENQGEKSPVPQQPEGHRSAGRTGARKVRCHRSLLWLEQWRGRSRLDQKEAALDWGPSRSISNAAMVGWNNDGARRRERQRRISA